MYKKKLIVMDHTTQEVNVYEYDENIWERPEDFQTEDCIIPIHENTSWMVVDVVKITFE